jgi:hypothetical protein
LWGSGFGHGDDRGFGNRRSFRRCGFHIFLARTLLARSAGFALATSTTATTTASLFTGFGCGGLDGRLLQSLSLWFFTFLALWFRRAWFALRTRFMLLGASRFGTRLLFAAFSASTTTTTTAFTTLATLTLARLAGFRFAFLFSCFLAFTDFPEPGF